MISISSSESCAAFILWEITEFGFIKTFEEADDFSIQSETFGKRDNDNAEQKQSEPLELELRGPYSEEKNEIAQKIKDLLRMKINPNYDPNLTSNPNDNSEANENNPRMIQKNRATPCPKPSK